MIQKIYILAAIVLTGLFLAGCSEDYLDTKKPANPDITNFYNTEDGLSTALNAAYGGLQDPYYVSSIFFFGDIISDDAEKGSEAGDFIFPQELKEYRASANNRLLDWRYRPLYRTIFRANLVIDKVINPEADFEDVELLDRFLGEAYFLRAFAYFDLLRTFGGVPKVDGPLGSNFNLKKAAPDEIWTLIESDLNVAKDKLWKKSDYAKISNIGRATKGAACALLGKAYLYQGKWADAQNAFNEVIKLADAGEYALNTDFANNFTLAGENGVESIFEIQFYEQGDTEIDWKNEGNFGVVFQMNRGNGWGWGFNQPTHQLIDEFGYFEVSNQALDSIKAYYAGDPAELSAVANGLEQIKGQKYLTIEKFKEAANAVVSENFNKYLNTIAIACFVSTDPRYKHTFIADGENIEDEIQDHNSTGDNTGYFSRKTYLPPSQRPSHWRLSALNEKIIRLADVYLMLAEAACENNDLSAAKTNLNKVRQRARMLENNPGLLPDFPNYTDNEGNQYQDTQDGLRKAIRNERRVELAMEHHRLWDLIRWDELKNAVPDNYPEVYKSSPPFLFPIPQSEIDLTNGEVQQNPGW